MPKISFIILTYNSSRHIDNLFNSINEHFGNEIEKGDIEVIVYDNKSSDSTIHNVKKYLRNNIKLHLGQENLGYAKGINQACKMALGEYLVVINPDSRIVSQNFEKIIEEFDKHMNYAIAGFKIKNLDGENEKNAGKFYNILTITLFALGLEDKFGVRFSPKKKTIVDYVSGGFIMFRKAYFEELDGYDEDYFMYVEDMDICYRAKRKGYEVIFLPYAEIEHKGQGSSSREFAIVNIYKGLTTFYNKNSSMLFEYYVRNLLSLKAALIIFIGSVFGNKELISTYTKALKTIS